MAYDAQYQRALSRQHSRQGQRMRRVRQRTIEPVFGSLLQHYGLRRVNTRGRNNAHKTMLLTAIAFNLKKLLKHQPTQVVRQAMALLGLQFRRPFWPFQRNLILESDGGTTSRKDEVGVLQPPRLSDIPYPSSSGLQARIYPRGSPWQLPGADSARWGAERGRETE